MSTTHTDTPTNKHNHHYIKVCFSNMICLSYTIENHSNIVKATLIKLLIQIKKASSLAAHLCEFFSYLNFY